MTGIATKVVEEIVVALGGRVVVMKRWEKKGRTTRKRMIRLNIVAVVVVDVVVDVVVVVVVVVAELWWC